MSSTALATFNNDLIIRFASKYIKDDGCWNWIASKDGCGYGTIKIGGKVLRAHRVSYQISNNRILNQGELVLHKCDNPSCVNPDHLFVGDQLVNMRDMAAKGRGRPPMQVGEKHSQARLTERDVVEILKDNSFHSLISRKFNVSRSTISMIKSKKNWKHIEA